MYRIYFGNTTNDLTDVEQIVEISQTKAITQAIDYLGQMNSGPVPIKESIFVACRL